MATSSDGTKARVAAIAGMDEVLDGDDLADIDAVRNLVERMRGGDDAARTELVERSLKLVTYLTTLLAPKFAVATWDELFSVAAEKAIRSIDTFDPGKGTLLSARIAYKVYAGLYQTFGRDARWERRHTPLTDYEALFERRMDLAMDGGEWGTMGTSSRATADDYVPDDKAGRAISGLEASIDLGRILDGALDQGAIDARTYSAMMLRGFADLTITDVAKRLGVSKSTASGIVARGTEAVRRWVPNAD
jgi:DNA-directed RNA polymerase specialized sigma subunit